MSSPYFEEALRKSVEKEQQRQAQKPVTVRVPSAGGYAYTQIPRQQLEEYLSSIGKEYKPLETPTVVDPQVIAKAASEQPYRFKPMGADSFTDPIFVIPTVGASLANGAVRSTLDVIQNWLPKLSFSNAYTTGVGLSATPTTGAMIADTSLAGITTGASVNDMIENGPTVENVSGVALGSIPIFGSPMALEGYTTARNAVRPTIVGMKMRTMPFRETKASEPLLNIGWGPRQTISVTHKSDLGDPLTLYNPKRWDVVNEGANPFGIWWQGKLGVPRTIENAATVEKAAKAEKARALFANRPYTHSGDLTLEKPVVTIGDVPNRSALSWQAEQMGADGLVYNNVYDNGYDLNQVILSFKQPTTSKVISSDLKLTPEGLYHQSAPILESEIERYTLDPSINKYVRVFPQNTLSIGGETTNRYLLNGEWNLPKIKEDLLAGKQDFIDWIESPAYRAAAESNMKEAEAMGLKYVPTYEYPAYQKLKNKGVQTVFVNDPVNNTQGWVRTSSDSPVTINLAKVKDIRTVNAHEDAHIARHAWLDPDYPLLDVKKQQAFLRHKNSQVFNDNLADLSEEAGSRFYDFSSTGFPHEAVTNSRDLGKYYGIKVGQEYPGHEKTLELLERMEQEASPGFQKKFVQSFKRDPEHTQFVWRALNGTQWSLLPIGLTAGAAVLNPQQK